MSNKQFHKKWRKEFNSAVFKRDKHKCRICGNAAVDAHHITDRHNLPNGGYVLSNGVALCEPCHMGAGPMEGPMGHFHDPIYSSEFFYNMISSSYEKAYEDSKKLN